MDIPRNELIIPHNIFLYRNNNRALGHFFNCPLGTKEKYVLKISRLTVTKCWVTEKLLLTKTKLRETSKYFFSKKIIEKVVLLFSIDKNLKDLNANERGFF